MKFLKDWTSSSLSSCTHIDLKDFSSKSKARSNNVSASLQVSVGGAFCAAAMGVSSVCLGLQSHAEARDIDVYLKTW